MLAECSKSGTQKQPPPPQKSVENTAELWQDTPKMVMAENDHSGKKAHPPCFGDEAKFVTYMEESAPDSECGRCPSEDDCGEYILLKCSQELIF